MLNGAATISILWSLASLRWIRDLSHFALETSMLTKHNMKRVSKYFHSWQDSANNKKFVASERGLSVRWGIWNIQIDILYLFAPTYLYQFLNTGVNVLFDRLNNWSENKQWFLYLLCSTLTGNSLSFHYKMKEWVSDCSLTPTQQFFSNIRAKTSQFSMRWWWGSLCTRASHLIGFL